jgi:hypothetical protein
LGPGGATSVVSFKAEGMEKRESDNDLEASVGRTQCPTTTPDPAAQEAWEKNELTYKAVGRTTQCHWGRVGVW